MRRIRWDTYIGMGFSNLIAFFIILSAAATLHVAGIVDIQTSAQAAEALRPLGGPAVFLLFSLGIIGTGMLAVPVLAGSAAYAVAESFDWQSGMDRKLGKKRAAFTASSAWQPSAGCCSTSPVSTRCGRSCGAPRSTAS